MSETPANPETVVKPSRGDAVVLKVNQTDGEIRIFDGAETAVYPVTDGTVKVPSEYANEFLARVDGSSK